MIDNIIQFKIKIGKFILLIKYKHMAKPEKPILFQDYIAANAAKYLMTLKKNQMKYYLENIQLDPDDEKLNNLYKIALEKEYYEICAEIKQILKNRENQ